MTLCQLDDLIVGGLRTMSIDAGCTDTFAFVLDGDQTSDADPEFD